MIRAVKAAVVAVGSELLGTDRLDTNSLRLTALLERHGVELRRKVVVGDAEEEIAAEIERLRREVDVLLVSGGLGPTSDDVTREAVAAVLGRRLRLDEAALETIRRRFERLRVRMPEVNRRQALRVEGAELLPNARGTAPGQLLEVEGCAIFLLPGVPHELEAMAEGHLVPWLARRAGDAGLESVTLRVAGLPESVVEERIAPAYAEFDRRAITVLASPGDVRVRATAGGSPQERRPRLAAMADRLAGLLGDAVYSRSEAETLEVVVGELLRRAAKSVATAESCTGGLVAERLTRVPGSSDYFVGGAVVYSNRLKRELLGVPDELLQAHGAVSEPVARAMAAGARAALGGDYALALTGVAGPGGGSAEKPVGTVHLALAGPAAGPPGDSPPIAEIEHRHYRLPGDRERVRWLASHLALDLLRRRLLQAGAAG
jgi:nicotinamide-nucleotide amidase